VRRNQQSGIAFLPISSSSPVRNNQLTDNTVIENGGNGIDVRQSPQNRLERNAIAQNGGHGIFFGDGAKQNTLVGNTIYNNSGFGISASTSTSSGNHWSQNAVYANLGGGITLVQGANGNLAAPLLLATANNRLTGQAKANATVEIFADSTTQGQFFQGQTTTDGSGNFIFIQAGNWFAPNLTAIVLDSAGNASPFSAPITATGTVATPAATVATATPTDMPTATATATATNTPPNTPTTTAIVSPPATFTPTATATTIATATATTTTTAQATRTTTPTPVVANQPNHRTYLPTIFR
jgi:parallel beta-helix repeat protein